MGRHTAVPLETRGLVAEHDRETGRLTVWGAAKVKHFNREVTAALLGLDPESVRLVEVDVGGGFGVRGEVYPEDVLVPFLALTLGRAVKWIEDRAEHLVATNHSREQVHEIAVAARRDGTLLAFEDRLWCDLGAYTRTHGVLPAILPGPHLPGPYAWDAFSVTSHAVLTNRTPVGTYRGPGMTEAAFVRERMLDVLAGELGVSPVDLRRRNLVRADQMPFAYDLGPDAPPIVYSSGDFPAAFEQVLERADLPKLESQRETGAAKGERIGIGVAAMVELGGIGPFEEASVEACSDGTVVVRAGVGSLGQGIETGLAQIAADELGVDIARVRVNHHDTDDVASGFGSFASRSTVVAGNAVALAARALRERAAEALGVAVSAVDAEQELDTLVGLGVTHGRFEREHPSFSFGAAVSVVAVEESTGRVRPLRARRGARRRAGGESRNRPWPARRRRRSGHRGRALRGAPVRRGRQPAGLDACRLRDADTRRAAYDRHRDHRKHRHGQPARREGRGRRRRRERSGRRRQRGRGRSRSRGERRSTACRSRHRGYARCCVTIAKRGDKRARGPRKRGADRL